MPRLHGSGFQTTYEELKLQDLAPEDAQRASFQTTYEELKPDNMAKLGAASAASRLPMRN